MAILGGDLDPITQCRGLADIEAARRIDADTPFELASVTKWFTAAVVMRFVERKDLELDTPLRTLIAELPLQTSGREITVRDLLQHTSGLRDYLEHGRLTSSGELSTKWVMEQLPQWVEGAHPGVEHSYSNTNYVVLARLLEVVSGSRFCDIIENELCSKIGLTKTVCSITRTPPPDRALGYVNLGVGLPDVSRPEAIDINAYGDGGIYSTLNDMIRWSQAFWAGEVVSSTALDLMTRPGETDCGRAFDYGLGVQIQTASNPCWFGHSGSWIDGTALVGRLSDTGRMLVLLSNDVDAPVFRIGQMIFEDEV